MVDGGGGFSSWASGGFACVFVGRFFCGCVVFGFLVGRCFVMLWGWCFWCGSWVLGVGRRVGWGAVWSFLFGCWVVFRVVIHVFGSVCAGWEGVWWWVWLSWFLFVSLLYLVF